MIVDLGQLSAIGCTKWQSDKEYKKGQMVIEDSDLYTALVANRGHNPSDESGRTYWEKNTNLKELMDRAQETVDAAEGVNRAIGEANHARDEAKDAAQYAIEYIDGAAKSKIDDAEAATASANNAANTALAEAQKANDATVNANRAAADANRAYNVVTAYHDSTTIPDHTRAEQDHTRADGDHTQHVEDHQEAVRHRAAEATEFNRTQQEKQTEFERTQAEKQAEFDSKEAHRDWANAEAVTFADNMADVNRDMGKYQQLPDVTLTLVESGKRIDKDGKFVADAAWNVGRLGAVNKGNIYEMLMGGSDKMVLGTALFVSHTIERIGGQDKDVYKPIFSAVNVDLPISTYAVLLAGEDYSDVLVSYRTDVAGANVLKVARWGIFASIATQLYNLRGDVDLKSFSDGYYDNMGVGFAKNLIGDGEANTEQFTERVAGGSHQIDDAVAEYVTVNGNSVVWNQKNTIPGEEISTPNRTDGYYDIIRGRNIGKQDRGTWLISFHPIEVSDSLVNFVIVGTINGSYAEPRFVSSGGMYYMIKEDFSFYQGNNIFVRAYDTEDGKQYKIDKFQAISLTQMFGAGNEPATYEEFLKRKPVVADEFAFNEGTIVNMTAEGVKTTGRNLLDDMPFHGQVNTSDGTYLNDPQRCCSDFIYVGDASACYISSDALAHACLYDKNKGFLSVGVYSRPSSGVGFVVKHPRLQQFQYVRFYTIASYGNVYKNDIALKIYSSDAECTYEPYQTSERKWAETMNRCFPEGMAKAGNVYDEMGATKAVKRIGKVEFDGTENWIIDYNIESNYSRFWILGIDTLEVARTASMLAIGYKNYIGEFTARDKVVYNLTKAICFHDLNYTTENAWKSHLADLKAAGNPLTVYFELAEPIVTTYDELNLTSRVWRNGMEEIIVPEGKESSPISADVIYQINAFKTIKANKQGIEDLNAKPAIGLTADEVAKIRALINPSTQNLEEE